MILLIDTTTEKQGEQLAEELGRRMPADAFMYVDTAGMKISHCLGCNSCWLKTPGECMIRDDFEPLLKQMAKAAQIWLITDTRFGFVTYRTKNIIDRYMPLMTMNLHFVGKQMRHVPRYDRHPDFGIVFCGDGDRAYLAQWCERVALNFAGRSLGVYSIGQREEAVSCML